MSTKPYNKLVNDVLRAQANRHAKVFSTYSASVESQRLEPHAFSFGWSQYLAGYLNCYATMTARLNAGH